MGDPRDMGLEIVDAKIEATIDEGAEFHYVMTVIDVRDQSYRQLYAVKPDGTVEMPDDLTIEQARWVLEQIGPSIADANRALKAAAERLDR